MRWFLGMLGMVALLGCQVVPAAATMARPVAAMAQSQAGPAFQPAKTYALLIGILEWRDPDLEPFPKENRQDRALERTLLARGVPRDQIVFLEDKQATLSAIRTSLKALQAKARKDSTLIVYFAGHGMQEYGKTWLCNYDVACDRPQQTGFSLTELGDTLAKGFRGGRVLLTADCCHSGALADVVKTVGKAGIRAASLSSVSPTDGSTERWTFTESLVRAWNGEGRIDLNGDGAVTFSETDTFVHDQMKYGEDQLTHGELAGGFEPAWRFAIAAPLPPGAFAGREYAECQRQNAWERVQLLARKPDAALVHYMTLGDRFDEWVPTSRLRPIATTRFKVGQRIEVDYDGVWEPAQVTKQAEDFFLFVNYSKLEDCNEWVTDLRVRLPGQGKIVTRVKSIKGSRH
jgi:hypothetical protein